MDSDADAVFAAEASIDRKRAQDGISNRKGRANSGEENTLLARGGIDTDLASEVREEDPLLPQSRERNHDGKDPAHEWASAIDFEHLPWYKRPSVMLSMLPSKLPS